MKHIFFLYCAASFAFACGGSASEKRVQTAYAVESVDELFTKALQLERQKDWNGASQIYQKILQIEPALESAAMNLSALFIEQKRFTDARSVAQHALVYHPQSVSLRLNAAIAEASLDHRAEAKRHFNDAVQRSRDPYAAFTYGHWLALWGEREEARQTWMRARGLGKDHSSVLASIGDEMRQLGLFAECIDVLDEAIGQQPTAEFLTERALCKIGLRREPEALADLNEAVRVDPSYPVAYFYRAGRLAASGRWQEAIDAYQMYIHLAPHGPLAEKAAERIEKAKLRK